jgi:hypothetical protein
MTQVECPFCSNPNFLAAATKGRATKIEVLLPFHARQEKFWPAATREYNARVKTDVEKRGEYLHTSFYGEDFEERWRDFTVEVFGIESAGEIIYPRKSERAWDSPPPPFLFVESVIQGPNQDPLIRQFFACRITHKQTTTVLIAHWWPSHGRLFTMGGKLSAEYPNDAIELFRSAFDFFHRETRGSAKVTDTEIKKVVALLGAKATQRNAAKVLNVSESTLEKWRQRRGISTWKEVVKSYSLSP